MFTNLSMLILTLALGGEACVQSGNLRVGLDPATHEAQVTATFKISGNGTVTLRLHKAARDLIVLPDESTTTFEILPTDKSRDYLLIMINRTGAGEELVTMTYHAHFEQDAAAGEVSGQIHNHSVSAHIGEDGIFLSDGSAWHPQWIDAKGRLRLMNMSVDVELIEGWAIVASGEPMAHLRSISDPVWNWVTPRPVEGMAIVGNHHVITGESHATEYGPVEIVMHVSPEHEALAPMFLKAAKSYLDLYVPLLGPFPYQRFSIVENFFSSGFAYPGFTVLGPQVVGMAPRSLAPGYLDHELLHNWWGNGVYVDPDDGNWCEALTTYCANYYRRIADDGEEAGRAYRRGILMKLSTDPETLDDGAPGDFASSASETGPGRFVGYDKGAFIFSMLDGGAAYARVMDDREKMFRALKRFAEDNLGRHAGWDDLRDAFEAEFEVDLHGFFTRWVRTRHLPLTRELVQRNNGLDSSLISRGEENGRSWVEIDPDFRFYRALPPQQLVPTIAGTNGSGEVLVITNEKRSEVTSYMPRLESAESGENLMLIGREAIDAKSMLIDRATDSITLEADAFSVGGERYDQSGQAVLHTMSHPDRPGRFITVFHANGDDGWSRLRLIGFYTRDTTIVWEDGKVIKRRTHEPDRRFWQD